MQNELLIWIGAILGLWLLYKLLFAPKKDNNDFNRELNEVLNSEKHKVKGRFE